MPELPNAIEMSEAPKAIEITDPVAVTINGRTVQAQKGDLLIDAAEREGVYIPRFCYHPRMNPVGMCRMCIVDVDTGRGSALQPSCMVECADGMVVETESERTKKAQDGVLEFLLINHPLDCPVCDKGGECPLQDQTINYGPGESRFVEEKRHWEKPIDISATVTLDRERCILCDRCTRFAKEVAGDPLIHFLGRGSQTQVNTFPDEPFSSYFSGNTVQICPVGALTAKPYRFRARPWDLEQVESTCNGCSVGCRISVQSSRNQVLRYVGVDSDPVNWGWLCDKGRFGFEAVNHEDRLRSPLVRKGDQLVPARWSEAMQAAAAAIADGLRSGGPEGLAVLGGARLTNEDQYAWVKLAKGLLGTDNVDAQMGDGLPAEVVLGVPRATIDQVCRPGGTILYLGPDPKEELAVLFLRLRHAVVEDRVRLLVLAPSANSLDDIAAAHLAVHPGHEAEVVRALLDGSTSQATGGVEPEALAAAAAVLAAADGPVSVVFGRSTPTATASTVVDAVALLLEGLPGARFLPALRRGNVHGALDLGMSPGTLPGRVAQEDGREWFASHWPGVPAQRGLDATGILTAAAEGRIDTLVLLGSDPLADFPDRDLADRALAGARTVIAVDTFLNDSSRRADVVLAAAGFAEKTGTTTNLEGRVSTVHQKVTPPGTAQADWILASGLARRLGHDLGVESVQDIWAEIEELSPAHTGLSWEMLDGPACSDGVVAGRLAPFEPATDDSAVADEAPHDDPVADASGSDAGPADLTVPDLVAAASEPGAADPRAADPGAADPGAADPGTVAADGDDPADPEGAEATDAQEPVGAAKPAMLTFVAPSPTTVERVDSYSLRLVAIRKLYDQGTLLQHAPSIAGLAGPNDLRLNPHDFERVGVEAGAEVRVVAPRGTLLVAARPDPAVRRGTAVMVHNRAGADPGAVTDIGSPMTDVRVELP